MLRVGERGFPRAEPVTGYAIPGGVNPKIICSSNTKQAERVEFLYLLCYNIYIMCARTYTDTGHTQRKRGHAFEEGRGDMRDDRKETMGH